MNNEKPRMPGEQGLIAGGRPQVTFVVPCYNEAKNVCATLQEIELAFRESGLSSYEIVVVDDCSTDNTNEIVAARAKHDSCVRLITNRKNLGFGGAYKTGIARARGTYVIMVPGDNAHPHEGITPILQQAGTADIIVPYVKNPAARSWFRRVGSLGFTALVNTLFGLDVPYFNGLVLHKTDLLRTIDIQTDGFAYQAEALVKLLCKGYSFRKVPVEIAERQEGRSSALSPRNMLHVAKAIFELWTSMRVLSRNTGESAILRRASDEL